MKMYSTGEVAKKLSVQAYKLSYMISTGKIKEPDKKIAGKRVWTEEEIRAAQNILEKESTKKNS